MIETIIILITYNGLEYTKECIESIIKSDYGNLKIIMVDNGSLDGTPDYIEKYFPDLADVIRNSNNLGFAEANNIGAQYAMKYNPKYLMLLNNDTVIGTDMIRVLANCATDNENAIIVPKIYYFNEQNKLWYAGGILNRNKGRTDHIGINEMDRGQYDQRKEVEFATGCCMLIPVKIYNDIGLFDPNYFMYFEDADFSTKVIERNYRILYEPQAKIWHKVSSSSGSCTSKFQVYYTSRNRLYFIRNNHKMISLCGIVSSWLFVICRGLKGFIFKTDAIAAWYGIVDYACNKMGKSNRKLK